MKLAVWSPLPPSASGIADYVAEQLPELACHASVTAVVEDPSRVDAGAVSGVRLAACQDAVDADLHLYHVGNSPAHAYVYRAALERPGVLLLHDWSVHHLVLHETVERGQPHAYLREMRRAHGDAGTFVGRQVARALGGDLLPALYPLNDRLLESSLAVIGLTEWVAIRARMRLPGRPTLHLPHHLSLPLDPIPSRTDARAALGLPQDALILTAPGLATSSKRLDVALRVAGRLRGAHPTLRVVVAGGVEPRLPLETWAREAGLGDALLVTGRLTLADFLRHLVAADVVLSLRFPSYGEMSGAREADELEALLSRLLRDPALRERIGCLARAHMATRHDLRATVDRLACFLAEVVPARPALERAVAACRIPEGTLLGRLLEEARFAALDLGLAGLPPGTQPLLAEVAGEHP